MANAFLSGYSKRKYRGFVSNDALKENWAKLIVGYKTTGTDADVKVYMGSDVRDDFNDFALARFAAGTNTRQKEWSDLGELDSGVSAQKWFKVTKVYSSVLTGNAAASQKVVDVNNASSFTANDWCVIARDDGTDEFIQIDSISTNEITFKTDLANAYTTADNAKLMLGYYVYYDDADDAADYQDGANVFVKFDDFEWGSDGDPIDDSGGSVTWVDISSDPAINDIDTGQKWDGTRSFIQNDNVEGWAAAKTSVTPSDNIAVRMRIRKEDGAEIRPRISNTSQRAHMKWEADDEKIYTYADGWQATDGIAKNNNQWYLIEFNNFDWTAGTFNIDLNGVTITTDADMDDSGNDGDFVSLFGINLGNSWADDFLARNFPDIAGAGFGAEEVAGWVSPTGHVDPDTAWDNETNVYDDNAVTYSQTAGAVDTNSWGPYLELTHAALYCDSVRFYALYELGFIDEISVDVYYSAGWHNIYEGIYANETWVTKAIGSTQLVTAARVKFYNEHDSIGSSCRIHEFDFHEVTVTIYYQGTGDGAITPIGVLGLKIMLLTGEGGITPSGVLGRFIKLVTGSGAITPAGALNRVIKLLVGEGSIVPVGTLTAVIKYFINVGQGAITAVGTLNRKIKLTIGGSITPVGTLGRKIMLAVGSGSITPTGALAALTAGIKYFVNVGQGAVAIAGALNRKIKLTIGQGAITPVGTLSWGMVRNLILKVTEGDIYRMVVNEGMIYRLKAIAGRIYRMITKEG